MKNSDIGKIQSYLYSIFGNLLKNYYKKKKDLLTKQMPEISENRLIEIEIRLDIEQAVDRLPEEIKETAIFFFFQVIKQKEIVDLLNRMSINFFYILINYMISLPIWRRKNLARSFQVYIFLR